MRATTIEELDINSCHYGDINMDHWDIEPADLNLWLEKGAPGDDIY